MKKTLLLLSLLISLSETTQVKSQGFDLTKYTMVFNDEFNGTSVDWAKWGLGETWENAPGNGYLNVKANCIESNGIIRFRGDQKGTDGKYHTGGIHSVEKFHHGYYEARFKIGKGQGIWPAFWLLDWYGNPEIDIMENLGDQPTEMYHTLQELSPGGQYRTQNGVVDYSQAFHTFGCAWFADSIIMFIDGKQTKKWSKTANPTWPRWGTAETVNIILNLQIGGDWPGEPDNTTVFPNYYDVDYVRYYKKVTTNTTAFESAEDLNIFPNPVLDMLTINYAEGAEVSVYDLRGMLQLKDQIIGAGSELDVSSLSSGIYFVKIRMNNKQVVEKFIKK